jgi:hypothetical protein
MAELSEDTAVTIPLRNLIAMIAFTSVSTMAYFSVQERLNTLEHALDKTQMDIASNSEFRIKWPRGELGALPADARQDMLIEYTANLLDKEIVRGEVLLDDIHTLKLRLAALEKGVTAD